MKVLHVLANSPPDVNGYAIRTQKLLTNQSNESIGLTSPWYPDRESMVEDYQIDGINYLRTVHPLWKENNKFSHKLVKFFTRKSNSNVRSKVAEISTKKILPLRILDFFYSM